MEWAMDPDRVVVGSPDFEEASAAVVAFLGAVECDEGCFAGRLPLGEDYWGDHAPGCARGAAARLSELIGGD